MALLSTHDILLVSVATIGLLSLYKTIFSTLKFAWSGFVRSPKRLSSYGSWAVVTGCTDGIGKAMALDLAKAGLNLVLVGRNISKLQAVTSEIMQMICDSHHESSSYGRRSVETRSVVVDFAEMNGEEIRTRIKRGIEGLDVGLLVNNAGVAYPYPKFFHEVDSKLMADVLRVNIDAATWVTEAVLPGMLKKGKGAVVNIGSGSSCCVPSYPLVTLYSASKAYIEMFSKCLSLEYRKQGIHVQCQATLSAFFLLFPLNIPLFVATKMTSMKRLSCLIASPEEYSQASLRWIGYDRCCVPFFPHYLQAQFLKLLPDSFLSWFVFMFFNMVREEELRKEAKAKASSLQQVVAPDRNFTLPSSGYLDRLFWTVVRNRLFADTAS